MFAQLVKASLLSTLVLVLGCSDLTNPIAQTDTPLTPLPQYTTWWQLDLECSGLPDASLSSLRWFTVSTHTIDNEDLVVAKTYWPQRDIRLVPVYVDDERIVRHEMLHALLYAAGKTSESVNHDPLYFHTRCGLL